MAMREEDVRRLEWRILTTKVVVEGQPEGSKRSGKEPAGATDSTCGLR